MSETKLFTGAKGAVKRVPKWAWYIAGGVAITGGVLYLRNRDAEGYGEAPGDESGAVGYTDGSGGVPGVIVAPGPPGEAVSAEINTDIPTSTLDVFGSIFAGLIDRIPTADDLQLIAGGGGGGVNPGNDPGGVVPVASPAPTPGPGAPKPNPCAKLGDGFHCGDTVNDGKLNKRFSGAVGWKRDSSAGTGTGHWIKYRIRYCAKLEIWQVYPNRPGTPWSKAHGQTASNIC